MRFKYEALAPALEDPNLWPSGVDEETDHKIREAVKTGKPLYWAIGQVIGEEAKRMYNLPKIKYVRQGGGGFVTEKTEGAAWDLGRESDVIEGYALIRRSTEEAFLIEQTRGEIENHPDYEPGKYNPDHAHVSEALKLLDADPSCRQLLKHSLREMIISSRDEHRHRSPHHQIRTFAYIHGFRRGLARYNELYNHFSR